MSESWKQRNEAWEARARLLGKRAVLHVGHKTQQQQDEITRKQRDVIFPLLINAVQKNFSKRLPTRLLDFGCGVGRWSTALSDVTGCDVLGVDPTEQFLEICRSEHRRDDSDHPQVLFAKLVDGKIPTPDEDFDIVWACMVLSTILDVTGGMYEEILKEIHRVLCPGGLMVLIDNTSGRGGREVRSPYSISRTVDQYVSTFAAHEIMIQPVGQYEDLGEINTIFTGVCIR